MLSYLYSLFQSKPKIQFDSSNLCKTTGWYNNCGVNCLTHFLLSKLEAGELQATFNEDLEYNEVLQTFQDFYGLSQKPTWEELKTLFALYPVPTDREGLFGPVLRKHLEKILVKNAEELWDSLGSEAFTSYLSTENATDVAGPVVYANQKVFNELREEFIEEANQIENEAYTDFEINEALRQLHANNDTLPSQEKVLEQIWFQKINDLKDKYQKEAKTYWLNEGCKNYAARMGNLENAEMISAHELSMLCNALHIGIEVYTPDSIESATKNAALAKTTHGAYLLPIGVYPWTFKIYNHGAHWEFQEPAQSKNKSQSHNLYYPSTFDQSFYDDDNLSGKFKLYGSESPILSEQIIRTFHEEYETLVEAKEEADQDATLTDNLMRQFLDGQITMAEFIFNLDHYSTKHKETKLSP